MSSPIEGAVAEKLQTIDDVRHAVAAHLREARIALEHAKAVYVSPYSGHDALVKYHWERGYQSGLARAVEAIDAFSDAVVNALDENVEVH